MNTSSPSDTPRSAEQLFDGDQEKAEQRRSLEIARQTQGLSSVSVPEGIESLGQSLMAAEAEHELVQLEKLSTATRELLGDSPFDAACDMRIAVAMMATVLEKQCSNRDACEVLERPGVAESVRRAREYLQSALDDNSSQEGSGT